MEALFESASNRAKSLNDTLSTDELKELYALYKQSTVGDVNVERPGMFDFKGKTKWDAWNEKKGMGRQEAMQKYVEQVEMLEKKHGVKQ